jgi:hypothetical protein
MNLPNVHGVMITMSTNPSVAVHSLYIPLISQTMNKCISLTQRLHPSLQFYFIIHINRIQNYDALHKQEIGQRKKEKNSLNYKRTADTTWTKKRGG